MAYQISSDDRDDSLDFNVLEENIDDLNLHEPCEFSTKSWREDMALVVENGKLFVASNILALVSPVFEAKIEEEFKEGAPREMVLDDQRYDDVVEFLRCVYPNILKPISLQNVSEVLPLAEKYKVKALTEKCEEFLVKVTNEKSSAETVYKHLKQASVYGLEDLKNKCVELASNMSLYQARCAEEQNHIPEKITLEIRERIIVKLIRKVTELEGVVRDNEMTIHNLQRKLKRYSAG